MAVSTEPAPPRAPRRTLARPKPSATSCASTRARGLSEAEAARRLGGGGAQPDPAPSRRRRGSRSSRASSPTRWCCCCVGAAAISLAIGELLDAAVILAIVVANAIFGAVQEGRADEAAAAVRALLAPTARLLRDGHVRERPAEVVVPGDVVVLGAGDRVPADGRLVDSTLLQVDESALTGESLARSKRADPPDPADAPLAERRTTVLAGTTVTRGTGRLVVTATGPRTEMGHIAGAAGRRRAQTPLQARLDRLTRLLIPMAAGIIATLALLSYLQGDTLAHSVLVGVSLAVAALPEGLPAVVTITLALSMRQMAERGAIVRRLAAVETLGSTTVICSDKTGTLTENRLAVQRLWAAPGATEADLLEAAVLASSEEEQADPLELAIIADGPGARHHPRRRARRPQRRRDPPVRLRAQADDRRDRRTGRAALRAREGRARRAHRAARAAAGRRRDRAGARRLDGARPARPARRPPGPPRRR